MKQVRDAGETIMKGIQGHKPDFAMLIDRRGRVVARITLDSEDFGDVVAGRPLIDDALAGYSRDDLWAQNGTMYFVSAAPVIKRDPPVAYVGAIVLGHKVTNDLASKLVASLSVDVGFSLGADDVAGSTSITFDHTPLQARGEGAVRRRSIARLPGQPSARSPRGDRRLHRGRGAAAGRSHGAPSVLLGVHQAPEARGFHAGTLRKVVRQAICRSRASRGFSSALAS